MKRSWNYVHWKICVKHVHEWIIIYYILLFCKLQIVIHMYMYMYSIKKINGNIMNHARKHNIEHLWKLHILEKELTSTCTCTFLPSSKTRWAEGMLYEQVVIHHQKRLYYKLTPQVAMKGSRKTLVHNGQSNWLFLLFSAIMMIS